MCLSVKAIGMCGHEITEWHKWEPEDPRDCAQAALVAVQKYRTPDAAVHCKRPEIRHEDHKTTCTTLECWVSFMLQQRSGWMCCQCLNHNWPVRKRCKRASCKHKACWVCPPYGTQNPLRVNPIKRQI